ISPTSWFSDCFVERVSLIGVQAHGEAGQAKGVSGIPTAPSLNLAPQLTPTSTRVILRREAKGRERREEPPMECARRDLLALIGLAFAGAMLEPSAGRAQTPRRGTLTRRVRAAPHI